MIILKFAMVFFLVVMACFFVARQDQGPLEGGPYYYMEMPGNGNPVKPNLRLNGWQAFHRKNVWRAWFDSAGHPVELKLYREGVLVRREKLVYDKAGKIRQRFRQ